VKGFFVKIPRHVVDYREGEGLFTPLKKVLFMKYKTNAKGLSLLEVLVAMLILAVGLLGLAPMMTMSIFGNTYSNETGSANAIAHQKVESLINRSTYGAMPYHVKADSVNGLYSVEEWVTDEATDATVPAGIYKISVSVVWNDKQGQQRTTSFSTFKSKS
jgi:type IV pilus modification protein PilV